jgi:DNA-binding transcriptional MerR regulator
MNSFISIDALSKRSGLSKHALRYYEKSGVLKPAVRALNGHRQYGAQDVAWLEFVLRLKATGMPLAEIREYAQLRLRGEATLTERTTLLESHRERLIGNIASLTGNLSVLESKIKTYRKAINKTTRFKSVTK